MSAYFQMGHDTENLVGEVDLGEFSGIVLSPVNRSPNDLIVKTDLLRQRGEYNIILDPQLYYPHSNRGKIQEYPYFPSDFDTADSSSYHWWQKISKDIFEFTSEISIDGLTTPFLIPKKWSFEYFSFLCSVNDYLYDLVKSSGIQLYNTIVIDPSQLTDSEYLYTITSILSRNKSNHFYIIFLCDTIPRRELANSSEILAAMSFIKELSQLKGEIIVSYCSSEMILFKVAGATHCASGKFFNLRRFTKARWEEPAEGGGQLPYWFEHSLLSFLRQSDIERLQKHNFKNLLAQQFSMNHWSNEILNHLDTNPGDSWLSLSWRQYLSWFGKTEASISTSNSIDTVSKWLKEAEANWLFLEDNDFLMEEPRNTGNWIRPWRQAIIDFKKTYNP